MRHYYYLIGLTVAVCLVSVEAWAPDVVINELIKRVPSGQPELMASQLDDIINGKIGSDEGEIVQILRMMRDSQYDCSSKSFDDSISFLKMWHRYSNELNNSSRPDLFDIEGPLFRLFNYFRAQTIHHCRTKWTNELKGANIVKQSKLIKRVENFITDFYENPEELVKRAPALFPEHDNQFWLNTMQLIEAVSIVEALRKADPTNAELMKGKSYGQEASSKLAQRIFDKFVVEGCEQFEHSVEHPMRQFQLHPSNEPIDQQLASQLSQLADDLQTCAGFIEKGEAIAFHMGEYFRHQEA